MFLNKTNFSETMEGQISNFRRAIHHTYRRQMVAKISGIDSKENAVKLIGKTVTWESPAKKVIKGNISATHGSNGSVRIIFEKGLPGQSIGTKITLD